MQQGSYPLNGRVLGPNDTATGVATGKTADIPLGVLAAFVGANLPVGAGAVRPASPLLWQLWIDTTLGPYGQLIYCAQVSPTVVWVNSAGYPV